MKVKILLPMRISFLDYPDPENCCVLIYFLGCLHECIACSNPNLQNHDNKEGVTLDYKDFEKRVKISCEKNLTNKVVLSGGDPLFKKNISIVKHFLKRNKKNYDICIYTGNDISYVKKNKVEGFKFVKCGKYNIRLRQQSMKSDTEMKFASTNQELYNEKYNLISKEGVYKFK